jgi:serine protease AprX
MNGSAPPVGLRSVAWTRMKSFRVVTTACLGLVAAGCGIAASTSAGPTARYIVEGSSSASAAAGVASAGGRVLLSLPIVHGVDASLTAAEAETLGEQGLSVSPDLTVTVESSTGLSPQTPSGVFTSVTGAATMWADGFTGSGVTVAVLDTGVDAALPDLGSRVIGGVDLSGSGVGSALSDEYGHGTFIAGLIASNGASSAGAYEGVAPGADLVSIKVAGATGITSESTVIEGVSWAIANKASDNIRVLNISLGVEPPSPTALDPLDQAVEQAWNAGIVVVTSAGNFGPDNGTISAPGDDPLVITVGAMDDNGAAASSGYTMTTFSSVGPTPNDGWFKPDLVAPGRSVVSLADPGSTIALANPTSLVGSANFVGSGTSFSAAIVSGLVALLLQAHPSLSPNEVKAALLISASAGPVRNPLVDGHGVADVTAASAVAGQVSLNQNSAAAAESPTVPATISLSSTWAVSTWNPANWTGTYVCGMQGVQLCLQGANLQNANLEGANLQGANLQGANLSGDNFQQANMQGVNLQSAVLQGPNFAWANMQGANLQHSSLQNAGFQYANLQGSNLQGVNGASANLAGGNLQSSDLTSANLTGASLSGAQLQGANLQNATFAGANLQGASLQGASLSNVTWSHTTCPDGTNSDNASDGTCLGHLGAPPPASSTASTTSSWTGAAWNGAAWNGAAWNALTWLDAAWNDAAWNDAAWNGAAWNDAGWNDAGWNDAAWNAESWG